ncbi:MAG: dihydrolipoyl dehydrogenase [Parvularcula sp.]
MSKTLTTQVLVVGGGPGGYVAGIRAGQLGLDTVLADDGPLGGTCLNVGCIPSKALIHVADEFHHIRSMGEGSPTGLTVPSAELDLARTIHWKDGIVKRLNQGVGGLLKKAKTETVRGRARLVDGKTAVVATQDGEITVRAQNIIIATGSTPAALPGLPFGGDVLSSTEALSLDEVPERLAVVGGGYIGMELGIAFAKMGAKVTIIEATGAILPTYDEDLVKPILARMKSLGIDLHLSTFAKGYAEGALTVEKDGSASTIAADKVLVTVGRKPCTEGWGAEELDLTMDGPFIAIDNKCRTSMAGVWAIGDVTGNPMLAHRAMAQGEMVAEIIAGEPRDWDKRAIPEVCFTDPEVVQVGLSAAAAKAAGHDVITGQFPFLANGRAMTMEDESGFVRVIARADNHLVLGVQAVGMAVSELSAEFSLAIEMGACLEDIAGTIHAHPSKSEGVQEAALKALGHALHI